MQLAFFHGLATFLTSPRQAKTLDLSDFLVGFLPSFVGFWQKSDIPNVDSIPYNHCLVRKVADGWEGQHGEVHLGVE